MSVERVHITFISSVPSSFESTKGEQPFTTAKAFPALVKAKDVCRYCPMLFDCHPKHKIRNGLSRVLEPQLSVTGSKAATEGCILYKEGITV